MKTFIGLFVSLLISVLTVTTASAHTGMEHNSILHNTIHIISSVGVYLAIMAAGFYLLRKLPKAQPQKIRNKDKK